MDKIKELQDQACKKIRESINNLKTLNQHYEIEKIDEAVSILDDVLTDLMTEIQEVK